MPPTLDYCLMVAVSISFSTRIVSLGAQNWDGLGPNLLSTHAIHISRLGLPVRMRKHRRGANHLNVKR
jgi:hypothetical protein